MAKSNCNASPDLQPLSTLLPLSTVDHNVVGCHGPSVFAQLPYMLYTTFFVLPLYHALLYGVARDFLNAIFSPFEKGETQAASPWWKVSRSARRIIAQREVDIAATAEYTHAHSSVLTKRGTWTMDEVLHFFLTWSTLVFSPEPEEVLHPQVFEIFVQLRNAIKYYGVAQVVDPVRSEAAAKALLQFSRLAERYTTVGLDGSTMPAKICSFNLHLLNCRLSEQERARGHVAFDNELWIERNIQQIKEFTKHRVSADPERLVTNIILTAQAMQRAKLTNTSPPLRSISEMRARPGYNASNNTDKLAQLGSCQLLGAERKKMTEAERQVDKQLVGTYISQMCAINPMGLVTDGELDDSGISVPSAFGMIGRDSVETIRVFARANRNNDEILNSSLYNKAKTRVDTWAGVDMEEDLPAANRSGVRTTRMVEYQANVHRFLLVTGSATATFSAVIQAGQPAKAGQPLAEHVLGMKFVLRLAICELWHTKDVCKNVFKGDLLVADKQWAEAGNPSNTLYPVDLSTIKYKNNTATYKNKRYFLKPYNVSRRL